ncbi:MAG: hypothetical protein Fur0042_09720 [Cyanophyceae cyanobacterium]
MAPAIAQGTQTQRAAGPRSELAAGPGPSHRSRPLRPNPHTSKADSSWGNGAVVTAVRGDAAMAILGAKGTVTCAYCDIFGAIQTNLSTPLGAFRESRGSWAGNPRPYDGWRWLGEGFK